LAGKYLEKTELSGKIHLVLISTAKGGELGGEIHLNGCAALRNTMKMIKLLKTYPEQLHSKCGNKGKGFSYRQGSELRLIAEKKTPCD
jgi:hypothetical protein